MGSIKCIRYEHAVDLDKWEGGGLTKLKGDINGETFMYITVKMK